MKPKTTEGKGIKREIKFRIWEYEAKEFLYLDPMAGGLFDSKWFINDEQSVVMQFTGLYDNKGTEIWEGDIVRAYKPNSYLDGVHQIVWDSNRGRWAYFQTFLSIKYQVGNSGNIKCEVIGNIYENENLLINHPTHH